MEFSIVSSAPCGLTAGKGASKKAALSIIPSPRGEFNDAAAAVPFPFGTWQFQIPIYQYGTHLDAVGMTTRRQTAT